MTPEVLLMSRKAWEELSPGDQGIFKQAAIDSSRFMRDEWINWEDRSKRQAAAAGNLIVDHVDKAPFAAAMAPVYAGAVATPDLTALVVRIKAAK